MEVLRRPYFSAKLVSVVISFTATISSSAKGRLSQRTNSNLPAAQRKANRKPHPQSGNRLPFHFCAALFMTALRIDGCHPIALIPAASLLPPPLGPVPISQRSPVAFGIAPRSQPPLPGRDLSRYIATGTPRLCTAHRGHNTIIHAPSGDHDQSFKTYRHNSMLSIRLTIIQTSVVMKISSLTIRWATTNPPVHYRCYDHLRPAVGVATLPRTTGYCAPVAAGILPAMRCSVRAASTAKDSASLAWLIMPYSEMFRTW